MFGNKSNCVPCFTDVDSIDGDGGGCDDELSEPCTTCGFLLNEDEVLRCPCGNAQYCGTACQARDWPEHQTRCSAALSQQSVEICSNCRTTSTTLHVCRCSKTYYCSRYCQKRHWVRHAHVCASRVHECNAAHLHRPTANKGTQFGFNGEEGDPGDASVSTASLSSSSSGKDRIKKLASLIISPASFIGSLVGVGGSSGKLTPAHATAMATNPLAAITAKAQQRASSVAAAATTTTTTAATSTNNQPVATGGDAKSGQPPLSVGDDAESDFLLDLSNTSAIHNASRIHGREHHQNQHHHQLHRTVASSSVDPAASPPSASPRHNKGKRLSTTVKFTMQKPRPSDAGLPTMASKGGDNPLSLHASMQHASFSGGVPRMDSIVASTCRVANTIAVAVYVDEDDPISKTYVGQDLSTIEIEARKLTRKSVLLVERTMPSGKC